jgi:hypothetical protein
LFVIPPVLVAAARLPCRSIATAPTVPCLSRSLKAGAVAGDFSFAFTFRSCSSRSGVSKERLSTSPTPCSTANFSAPAPASNTCSLRSITSRASSTGFFTRLTAATAPAFRFEPSMTAASSSCVSSAV